MRPDAARNRARIVTAARELVSAHGPDVGMDAIARCAGVAVGTLYRHYPTKADLVAAVLAASVEQLAETTEKALAAVRSGADPWETTSRLFREVAEQHVTDKAVKAASASLGTPVSMDPSTYAAGSVAARAGDAIGGILRAAQEAGQVRDDVTVTDLAVLLAGVPGAEAGDDVRARYVDIVLTGLRADSS